MNDGFEQLSAPDLGLERDLVGRCLAVPRDNEWAIAEARVAHDDGGKI